MKDHVPFVPSRKPHAAPHLIPIFRDETLSISPGTKARSLYATAGVHPHDAKQWTPDTRSKIIELQVLCLSLANPLRPLSHVFRAISMISCLNGSTHFCAIESFEGRKSVPSRL